MDFNCNKLNQSITELPLLKEAFNMSDFFIQPHAFRFCKPYREHQLSPHSHKTYEISMILSGEITFGVDGLETNLSSGDLSIIPPGEKHFWKLSGQIAPTVSCFQVFISPKGERSRQRKANLLDAIGRRKFHIHDFREYQDLNSRIVRLLQNPKSYYQDELRLLQRMSFVTLFQALLPDEACGEEYQTFTAARLPSEKTVELAKYFIFNHLSHPIKLSEIGRQMGMTGDHLNRIFKEHEKVPIGQYLTDKKMERAQRMLRSTNASIKTIAMENGYSDANYFCRLFKKHSGVTPSEYRHDGS